MQLSIISYYSHLVTAVDKRFEKNAVLNSLDKKILTCKVSSHRRGSNI